MSAPHSAGGSANEAGPLARLWALFLAWIGFKSEVWRMEAAEVDDLVAAWTRACEGAQFVRKIDTVSGSTVVAPRITHVTLGPPTELIIQLQPGMVPGDLVELAPRIAPFMGAYSLRIEPRGLGDYVKVTLLLSDPLGGAVTGLPAEPGRVTLGLDENGCSVSVPLLDLGHMCVQGQTGSGKSTTVYGLLAQIAEQAGAGVPVQVAGVDPSGVTLRPWEGSPHAARQVCGLKDPSRVEMLLTDLVDEMDRRIAAIPRLADCLPVDVDNPVIFVVLEEYPGLLRTLDAYDAKVGKRARLLVSRLLCEGRKAGFRVWLLAQRAESAVIGSMERAQCSIRISHRVDTESAVELLHPGTPSAEAERHTVAPAGIALVSRPGFPLTRMRARHVSYEEYANRVSCAVRP